MEEKILQKFITDVNSKIGWLVCIASGSPVKDSNWVLRDGSRLHDGYKAARILKAEDDVLYKVVCSIEKSTLGLPVFKVAAFKLIEKNVFSGDVEKLISGLKMTPICNQIIADLNVNTKKRWSGVKFFGLDRADVKRILKTSYVPDDVRKTTPIVDEKSNKSDVVNNLMADGRDNCPWIGVQSFGHVVTGEFSDCYVKDFNGQLYNVRRGFVSTRGVKCVNGKVFVVTCKVSSHGPLPSYVCEADEMSVSSENISTAVSNILKSVNAVTKRHWSGFEFFGFVRKDVLNVLRVPDRCHDVEDNALQDIQNIRLRNAGPTGDLKSKQAIARRNSKIDSVVEYASFGDIKSNFFFIF